MVETRLTANFIAPNHDITAFARWQRNTDPVRHWYEVGVGIWWRSNTVPLRTYEICSTLDVSLWLTAMEVGRHNWNISAAPVTFLLPCSSSDNRVIAMHHEATWFGEVNAWPIGIPFRTDRFTLMLNSRRITSYALERSPTDDAPIREATLSTVITSVMGHELGHVVGLQDGPSGSPLGPSYLLYFRDRANASIMNVDRDRLVVTRPTPFDIESVKMIYD